MEARRTEQNNLGLLKALSDKLWGNANSRMGMSATPAQDVYEIRPRKNRDGFDLISDRLRFGPIWYAGPDAVRYALAYAKYRSLSRSHRAIIRVFYEAGNVIETREHAGTFKEW
jgi:hypothetical protein